MALRAGRVGVDKSQVDEFGKIIAGGSSDDYYTKSQADNKFETKTHASNTYLPKTMDVGAVTLPSGSSATFKNNQNYLYKMGKFVFANVWFDGITASVWGDGFATIPEGYRPKEITRVVGSYNTSGTTTAPVILDLQPDGRIRTSVALASNEVCLMGVCWVVE